MLIFTSVLFAVQNGAVTQKDSLNDDEFEPYLNTQARQVSVASPLLSFDSSFKKLECSETHVVSLRIIKRHTSHVGS